MVRRISAFPWHPTSPRLGLAASWTFPFDDVGGRALSIAVIVAACLLIVLATGAVATPSARPAAVTSPSAISAVLGYALVWKGEADDPSIALPSGIVVKSSNYRGVVVGGATYYYNLAPRLSYDPLARGEVTRDQIQVVAVVGDAPNRVMIYTVRSPP